MQLDFEEEFERQEKRQKLKSAVFKILKWVIATVLAITAAFLLTRFCVQKTELKSDYMSPTLEKGDTILISTLSYIKNGPDRFDVIVYKKSGKEHDYYAIQRVIGLPGEKIQIIDGIVYINGEPMQEYTNVETMKASGMASEPVILDENEYFVLGDNRNNSEDSRFNTVGNVQRDEIIGKAIVKLNGLNIISRMNLYKEEESETGE